MKEKLLTLLIYLIISIVYTFPLVFRLGSAIYGYAGDNLGAIHYLWWWKYTTFNHLPLQDSFFEQAPFGYRIDSEPGFIFYSWPLKLLVLIFDAVTTYNLVLIISFPLSALTMYLLVRSLTNNRWVSLWAGFVYSFSPYHFWKAYNHLDLSLIWGPPLTLLFLFRLFDDLKQGRPVLRNSLLTGLAAATTILTNLYYGYFLFLTLGVLFLSAWIFYRFHFSKILTTGFLVLLISSVFSIPFLFSTVKEGIVEKGAGQSLARQQSYQRPILDLVSLSARPWDFLIPSQDNPWLGFLADRFYPWIRTKGADFKVISGPVHERTIFLGYASLVLSFAAFYLWAFSRGFKAKYGTLFLVLISSAFLLFVISLPPYFFAKGKTWYLPSFLLYQVVTIFRTYSRLGIFILMLIVPVAALTANFLSKRMGSKRRATFYLLLFIFSAGEFANVPPPKVEELKMPAAFEFLSRQSEKFNFVVYPKEFNVADLLVFQPKIQKGFLNFHSQSPYYKLWQDLADFRNPKTIQLLSALGVKYAVFQKKLIFPNPNPVDDLWYTRALGGEPGKLNDWFKIVADFEDSAVYQVAGPPAGLIVINGARIDTFPKGVWVWERGEGKIFVRNVSGGSVSIDAFLKKEEGETVRAVKYNGVVVKESGGGFYLNNLQPENFLSVEPKELRNAHFSLQPPVLKN